MDLICQRVELTLKLKPSLTLLFFQASSEEEYYDYDDIWAEYEDYDTVNATEDTGPTSSGTTRINYAKYGKQNKSSETKNLGSELPADTYCGIVETLTEKCLMTSLLEMWRFNEAYIETTTQQLGEVPLVAEPGALCQQVDSVYDLLLGGCLDVSFVKSPHLEEAGLEAFLVEGVNEVAVDVHRKLFFIYLNLVAFTGVSVLAEVDSLHWLLKRHLLPFIDLIFIPKVIVIVVLTLGLQTLMCHIFQYAPFKLLKDIHLKSHLPLPSPLGLEDIRNCKPGQKC